MGKNDILSKKLYIIQCNDSLISELIKSMKRYPFQIPKNKIEYSFINFLTTERCRSFTIHRISQLFLFNVLLVKIDRLFFDWLRVQFLTNSNCNCSQHTVKNPLFAFNISFRLNFILNTISIV